MANRADISHEYVAGAADYAFGSNPAYALNLVRDHRAAITPPP
jgi:hypothetical protein